MLKIFSYRRILFIYTTWWLIWCTTQFYILQNFDISYQLAIVDSVATNLLLAFIGLALYHVMRFYDLSKDGFFNLRIWVALITVFCSLSVNWFLQEWNQNDATYLHFLKMELPIRYCYNFLMVVFISLLNWLVYYFKNERESFNRKSDAEKLAREAELTGLRQQLQPHFLFNSLNSISALAGTKPEEARKMIQQLSDFLRGTLKKDDHQLVTLRDELQHLELYLEIEKVRFGHRLKTLISSDESSLSMFLPSLLLQPIVENAIKFGLYDTTEDITINIQTKVEGNDLIIEVTNPFDPETASPNKGTGFGLNSVQRRLYLLFSRSDLLQTHSERNIFTTAVKIPQV